MDEFLSVKIKHLSFFAVLLVVFIHAYNIQPDENHAGELVLLQYFISHGVARVGVPFFFFFSGILYFKNFTCSTEYILLQYRKRMRSLLIPYILWWGWCLFLAIMVRYLFNLYRPGSDEQLMQLTFTELLWRNPFAYHLWFLRDLMVLALCAPLLFWVIRISPKLLLLFTGALWILNITYPVAGQALFFFATGAVLQLKYPIHLLLRFAHYPAKTIGAVWMILLGLHTYLLWRGDMSIYVMNTFHAATVLWGMFTFWVFYDTRKEFNQQRFLKWGTFTFFIYAAHEPVLTVIKKGLLTISGKGDMALCVVYFLAPVLTILMVFGMKVWLQRFLPGFYTLITGGR